MNILFFHTKRKCWIWDFLILMLELIISGLPKRLRLILEPTNRSFLIDPKYHNVENQSGELN
jgi:hypothetical protein